MTDVNPIDRAYGPPEPVMAEGGLEYRYELPYPNWENSTMTVSDLAEHIDEIRDMGRKRVAKRRHLTEMMETWPETDMYVFLRFLMGSPFPHPGVVMNVDSNAVYEGIGLAFGPDGAGEEWGRRYADEYGSTTEGLRTEEPDSDEETWEVPLGEIWGKWLYALAEESRPSVQAKLLGWMFERMEHPWFLAEAYFTNYTYYCGAAVVFKSTNNVYEQSLDAKRAWHVCGDVCTYWLNASRGTNTDEFTPHCYHHTMKANTTTSTSVDESLDHDKWLAQTKYDGARLFVHHAGDGDIRAYMAGGGDVTAALPELQDIDWPDHSFAFDCEATPYDSDGNVVPFENILTRLTRSVGSAGLDPDDFSTDVVFKFFDCMYWRNRDITLQKYTDRFTIVRSVFDLDNVARTGESLETTFHASLDEGHEGLVLKRKDSQYECGGRHGTWLKWKPEPETVDAVVLDVLQGNGRLADRMGALRIGLGFDGEIESVGRVGTGFSDRERMEFWRDYEVEGLPGMVVEVEFENMQQTGDGWALRFPRFVRRRPDGDVDTLHRAAKLDGMQDEFESWAEEVSGAADVAGDIAVE